MKKLMLYTLLCVCVFSVYVCAASQYTPIKETTFRNHTYQLFDESMTWHDAREYCASIGGYLATITSQEEQDAIAELIGVGEKYQYWLGGTDGFKEGKWTWITGEEWSYENWFGKPDNFNDNEHFLQIFRIRGDGIFSRTNKWNDINKKNTIKDQYDVFTLDYIGFICEFGEPFVPGETYFGAPVSGWAQPEVEAAYELGLIPDTLLDKNLKEKITRGEFAAISVSLYQKLSDTSVTATDSPFTDIAKNENKADIQKAYKLGITLGISDTEFDPNALIWREQLAAMLCRTIKKYSIPDWTIEKDDAYVLNYDGVEKYMDDHEISEYAKPSVYYLTKHGIINGILPRVFSPKKISNQSYAENLGTATREQAISMALRIVKNKNSFQDLSPDKEADLKTES